MNIPSTHIDIYNYFLNSINELLRSKGMPTSATQHQTAHCKAYTTFTSKSATKGDVLLPHC